jgi:hypothetical protein
MNRHFKIMKLEWVAAAFALVMTLAPLAAAAIGAHQAGTADTRSYGER